MWIKQGKLYRFALSISLLSFSACNMAPPTTGQGPSSFIQPSMNPRPLMLEPEFKTKSLLATPPSPVPLPSLKPCEFNSDFRQSHYMGSVQAHYEIYGRGTQQEDADTQAASSTLQVTKKEDGSLQVAVAFSTQPEDTPYGNFHGFRGQVNIPNQKLDEDFTYTGSANPVGYEMSISRADYSIQYVFIVSNAQMTLNYTAKTRSFEAKLSGSSSEVDPLVRQVYFISGGKANFSGVASFVLPECDPSIDLIVNPSIISANESGEWRKASVGIAVSRPDDIWNLDVKAPDVPPECMQPGQIGSGNQHFAFPFNESQVANGLYTLEAKFLAFPNLKDTETIKVDLPVSVSVDKAEFRPRQGESVTFTVKAPPCPNWKLVLTGPADVEVGNGFTCTQTFEGSGNESKTWGGDCRAVEPETGSGRAAGEWTATLMVGTQSAPPVSVTAVTAPIPSPSTSPCPEGQTCQPLECPPGMVCPQPTQTPQSPEPTQTPFPGDTPTPGSTQTPGSTSTPGPTVTPPSESTPTPGPTSTPSSPTETPTPTPTPEGCSQDFEAKKAEVIAALDELQDALDNFEDSAADIVDDSENFGIQAITVKPKQIVLSTEKVIHSNIKLEAKINALEQLLSSYCIAGSFDEAYENALRDLLDKVKVTSRAVSDATNALISAFQTGNRAVIQRATLAYQESWRAYNKADRELRKFLGYEDDGDPENPCAVFETLSRTKTIFGWSVCASDHAETGRKSEKIPIVTTMNQGYLATRLVVNESNKYDIEPGVYRQKINSKYVFVAPRPIQNKKDKGTPWNVIIGDARSNNVIGVITAEAISNEAFDNRLYDGRWIKLDKAFVEVIFGPK